MIDDREEHRNYRKKLFWACDSTPDEIANRVIRLEARIKELEAEVSRLNMLYEQDVMGASE